MTSQSVHRCFLKAPLSADDKNWVTDLRSIFWNYFWGWIVLVRSILINTTVFCDRNFLFCPLPSEKILKEYFLLLRYFDFLRLSLSHVFPIRKKNGRFGDIDFNLQFSPGWQSAVIYMRSLISATSSWIRYESVSRPGLKKKNSRGVEESNVEVIRRICTTYFFCLSIFYFF